MMLGIAALGYPTSDGLGYVRDQEPSEKAAKKRRATRHMLNLSTGGDLRGIRRAWRRVYRDEDGALYVQENGHDYDRLWLSPEIVAILQAGPRWMLMASLDKKKRGPQSIMGEWYSEYHARLALKKWQGAQNGVTYWLEDQHAEEVAA